MWEERRPRDMPLAVFVRWPYLKYALLGQFYIILTLEFFYVLPTSYPILAASGLLFVCGLLLLVYRGLVSLLRQNFILSCLVVYFVQVITMWMYFKNATFSTYFFDLGNFMQPLYLTLYGHQLFAIHASPLVLQGVTTSPVNLSAPNSTSALIFDFSPLLFLLLPFYAVYPSATTLFVLQNIAIALPALLIFKLVEDKTKRLWVSLLYLGYSPIYFVAFFDFHSEVFFPLFLFLAVYFMRTDTKWYYVSIALFLSVDQAGAALLAFFLPYIYSKTKSLRLVLWPALMAGAFALAAFAFSGHILDWRFLVPSTNGVASSALSGLGGKLTYAMLLLAPLLFIPLLEPLALLPAGAWLAYAFLRNYFPFISILFQYNMLAAGFIFLGLIGAAKRVDQTALKVGLVVSLVVFAASWPQSSGYIAGTAVPFGNPATARLEKILQEVPSNATVMASDSVYPALANRLGTYFDPNFPPQWIILVQGDHDASMQQAYANYYVSKANYTILEDDSLLFVARLDGK